MITSEDLFAEDNDDNFMDREPLELVKEAEEGPDGHEDSDDDNENKKVKPKRMIRNPQPKLNGETLKSKRGLTALESYFERVKFKGKGHEEQDLNVILKTYEYWCHRLFPKYPFDACVAKIEKLGAKREVVTHVKKIRLDMIYEDQPTVEDNESDSSEEDNQSNDLFQATASQAPTTQAPVALNEEQMEQIRINRERAEQRRQERLAKQLNPSLLSQNTGVGTLVSAELDGSTPLPNLRQSNLNVSLAFQAAGSEVISELSQQTETHEEALETGFHNSASSVLETCEFPDSQTAGPSVLCPGQTNDCLNSPHSNEAHLNAQKSNQTSLPLSPSEEKENNKWETTSCVDGCTSPNQEPRNSVDES